MAVNGIELQVGQVWRTRDGRYTRLEKTSSSQYPWMSEEHSLTFTDEGEFDPHGGATGGDLISPISGPGIGAATPPSVPEPVLVPPPHSHYFLTIPPGLSRLDVYRLCLLAQVTDPCAQHILKKVLFPGQRGAKTERQDWENIRDTAARRLAMMDEDGVA